MDEISILKAELKAKDDEIQQLKRLLEYQNEKMPGIITVPDPTVIARNEDLTNEEIARYSRQLILPEIGIKGQTKLKSTSILIVGAGGLGCPAAVYLAAAGIGKLGLVDYDEVEISNLHRQILHTQARKDWPKSASAAYACNQLNSGVDYVPYHFSLTSENALDLIKQFDIVLDATDNVASRYLLNDACVLLGKPLVSGSALRFEGQLTVYNHNGGPCYRCLYPKPPPPETVTNCSDGGVLGVVPGIIGSIQALEAMKIAIGMGTTYSQRLLLFDALESSYRSIKLRPRQKSCLVCGEAPSITKLIDYEQFCGAKATDKDKDLFVLSADDRMSVKAYNKVKDHKEMHILVDVRQPVELEICQLPGAINIPIDKISRPENIEHLRSEILRLETENPIPVYVVCRRGNDSQVAVNTLKDKLSDLNPVIKDIQGGLTAWAKQIDKSMPIY